MSNKTPKNSTSVGALLVTSRTIEPLNRQLPTRAVCARYGIAAQTVDRWLERGLLPEPMRVRRYRYWSEAELDVFDQRRMAAQRKAQSSSSPDASAKLKSEHAT